MNILVMGGLPTSLLVFRGPLIRAFLRAGHTVRCAAGGVDDATRHSLEELGVPYHALCLSRAGMGFTSDLRTFADILRILRFVRPDLVVAYTIKPVIYGNLAVAVRRFGRMLKADRSSPTPRFFSLITGLGYAFMDGPTARQRLAGWIARFLYKTSLRFSEKIFFQNPDDLEFFVLNRLMRRGQACLLNGSGVDLEHYRNNPLPPKITFLLIARLLVDKGLREYVSAARRLLLRYPGAGLRFMLVGATDPNPSSISQAELDGWIREGVVDFRGWMEDVRPAIAESSVYVLPSYYREGTPRTVLEAMSTGRAIITTDAPGCRETVLLTAQGREQKDEGGRILEGENGFLVRVRDVDALVEAMGRLINQPGLITQMGARSREIAEEKYDVRKVNEVMLEAMGL